MRAAWAAFRRVQRSENPVNFWGIVALYGAIGIALIAGSLYQLLA